MKHRPPALAALTLALLLAPAVAAGPRVKADRVISGQVYFTNNSPERSDYAIELWTRDESRLLRRSRATRDGGFVLRRLRPAVYVFRIHGPAGCLLRYKVDTRRRREFDMTIVMDAACSNGNYLRDAVNRAN